MPTRRRLPVQLTPYEGARVSIGHNGGPALDVSWEAWLWRRAHAQAWKPPRREIALHRLRRAERLGLDYRSYAGVLMNRGTHLGAAVFLLDGAGDAEIARASERISAIPDCRVLIGVDDRLTLRPALAARADMVFESGNANELVRAIDRFLLAHQLTPGGTFMVGASTAHLRAAEDTGLALFLWAKDYFEKKAN